MPINRDTRVREMIFPTRIVKVSGNVHNAESLLRDKELQITTVEPDCVVLENEKNGEDALIVLDFGKELNGSLRILSFTNGGCDCANVHITLGESVSEALSKIGIKNATNDHAIRDFDMLLPNYGDMISGESGFRFACIQLKGQNVSTKLKAIVAVAIYHELPYIGTFRCNNETINRIFDTAAYTCHLCIQNYIWDGIKRDRLVWVGDMHPDVLTIRTVFGNIPMVADTVRFMREQTPLPGWMNDFPTYSMWWIMIVYDWYMYSGSREFLEENRFYVLGLTKQLVECVSEDGREIISWYFLDWPCHGRAEGVTGSRALLALGLEAAEKLAVIYGNGELAKECTRKRQRLMANAPGEHNAKQVIAMLSLANWYDKEKASEEILENGAYGWSTFMSYYLMKAAAYGNITKTLHALEEYYGTMLNLGATTFWEDFDLNWAKNASSILEEVPEGKKDIHGDCGAFCYEGYRHSLCHGWSSAPTAFLLDEVVGIRILEPGCKKISVKPNLGDLKWVEATYPTPYGVIRVNVKKLENKEMKIKIDVPETITVV